MEPILQTSRLLLREMTEDDLPALRRAVLEGDVETGSVMSGQVAGMLHEIRPVANGGLGKAFGRMLSGDSIFQNRYTAQGGQGLIAFASSFPGSIRAFDIGPGRELVVQKSGFLASEAGVQLSVFFQKKLGSGFFGGEGFIMQKLSGRGIAFTEFDGHIVEYDLDPGESLVVDTGYLAAMDATCSMDIQAVPGLKNMVFGGEGIFNTIITGPGHVYLQTMPISQVAGVLRPFMPTAK